MRVSYSAHADASLVDRELTREWVERVLSGRKPSSRIRSIPIGCGRSGKYRSATDGVLSVVYVRQGDRYRVTTVFFDRGRTMKTRYDPEVDVLYVRFAEATIIESERCVPASSSTSTPRGASSPSKSWMRPSIWQAART
jgi:hypothetical protein